MRTKQDDVTRKTPLAVARESLGFSQERLAVAASVSRSLVARLECGRGSAEVDSLQAIANALGSSVPALFPDFRPAVVVYRSPKWKSRSGRKQ